MRYDSAVSVLALLACSGCLAASSPPGSKVRIEDEYPDEVHATLEAWTRIMGTPRGAQAVLDGDVLHGDQAAAHAMCWLVLPKQQLDGCSHSEDGKAMILIVDGRYRANPFVVEHEISHMLAVFNGIKGGDGKHEDARIWSAEGVVHAAAATLGHVVNVAAPEVT
jgi:hypothetical protein